MSLDNLFATQKVLRDRIGYNEPDRFNKLILALLVELGECANEWRGFKFWSQDQQPRTLKSRQPYMDLEDADFYNPLLEEYVDKLHFILELGLEIETDKYPLLWKLLKPVKRANITKQFLKLTKWIVEFEERPCNTSWRRMFAYFIGLGEMLGFTWEEIEAAYFAKNQINHNRQDSGTY